MTLDLFEPEAGPSVEGRIEPLGPQSCVLRGFALPTEQALVESIDQVTAAAPFRHMVTPGGQTMSVALTNCGPLGWITDRRGYRYSPVDPLTQHPWPAMPACFLSLAQSAAEAAGFVDFTPDACLINRYEPGSRMGLHQDRDEQDFNQPIVSVSLGIPAVFQFGGLTRQDRPTRIPLFHGDVVVWGGVDRLRFHGILTVKEAMHPLLGARRINFTFRKAG
ncbi:MAG: DNA oxidative demethylase AlkB [Burkholderiales bacterium]|nr:DNA oxidative demethylase AlkB [Burkholderiales bacterium]